MKDDKHTQGQMADYKERLRKISDPVKKAEESCRIADEMYAANAEKFEEQRDQELRLKIVSMTSFSLDEADLAYQFVKGNNNALSELKEFRQWKEEKFKKEFEFPENARYCLVGLDQGNSQQEEEPPCRNVR